MESQIPIGKKITSSIKFSLFLLLSSIVGFFISELLPWIIYIYPINTSFYSTIAGTWIYGIVIITIYAFLIWNNFIEESFIGFFFVMAEFFLFFFSFFIAEFHLAYHFIGLVICIFFLIFGLLFLNKIGGGEEYFIGTFFAYLFTMSSIAGFSYFFMNPITDYITELLL